MIYTQLLFSIFIIFAVSRALLRFNEGKISFLALLGWVFLWLFVEIIIWIPDFTTHVAKILGIGRGADLIIYGSIVALFYLVFRIYVKLEDIERQITQIARKFALQKISSSKKSKHKK